MFKSTVALACAASVLVSTGWAGDRFAKGNDPEPTAQAQIDQLPLGTSRDPARPKTTQDVEQLPTGTFYVDPANGLIKRKDNLPSPRARGPPEPMCSPGPGSPVTMVMDSGGMTIVTEGKDAEHLIYMGTVGTDLNGWVYATDPRRPPQQEEVLLHTSILLDDISHDEPVIYIFRDRVWWPCSHPLARHGKIP
jgi:hypothetical protein